MGDEIYTPLLVPEAVIIVVIVEIVNMCFSCLIKPPSSSGKAIW
jgi:hypothetical protein